MRNRLQFILSIASLSVALAALFVSITAIYFARKDSQRQITHSEYQIIPQVFAARYLERISDFKERFNELRTLQGRGLGKWTPSKIIQYISRHARLNDDMLDNFPRVFSLRNSEIDVLLQKRDSFKVIALSAVKISNQALKTAHEQPSLESTINELKGQDNSALPRYIEKTDDADDKKILQELHVSMKRRKQAIEDYVNANINLMNSMSSSIHLFEQKVLKLVRFPPSIVPATK